MSPALHAADLALLNSQSRLPAVARLCVNAAVLATRWDRHLRTRRVLAGLTTEELTDIGLSRQTALAESRKPFWRD